MKRWLGAIRAIFREPVQLAILVAGLLLIGLTWLGTLTVERAQQAGALARANSELANRAALFENQVRRRLFAVDQTLRILEDEWERDPAGFNLAAWQRRARVISDPGVHVYITDARGIVRVSSRADLVGIDLSALETFKEPAALSADDGQLFIDAGAPDPVTRQWRIALARRLDSKDGQFAGIIGLGYDPEVIASFINEADLQSHGMIAVVGTRHGRIYAGAGAPGVAPGGSIAGTPLFAAIQATPDGIWTGAALRDGDVRACALRQILSRPLEVAVCADPAEMLALYLVWQRMAWIFAGCVTFFLLALLVMLSRERHAARLREGRLAEDQRALEAVNAGHAAARALAEAHAAELDAILNGITDGVSLIDADMRLTQWNPLFSAYTGVPADILRAGLPMTDILRAQAQAGEFGPVDVETEVAHRIGRLRAGSGMGVMERPRPNGQTLEMRRSALPQGGFVTLYSDITKRKQAERAMETAREIAEAAVADKSRFVAIVSHEIRTPLNILLNALTMLHAEALPARQRDVLGVARQSGDALLGLLDDILEMSRADAGQLSLRPCAFALRPLLESVLEIFQDQAAARGISLRLALVPGLPNTLYTDAGRLRQVLMNLVSNAVKYSHPGQIVLRAATILQSGRTNLSLGVRDCGPAIAEHDRARLFQPFSRLEQLGSPMKPGTGLGLVICQRLTALMGGEIGYREAEDGGNEFWITLPLRAAPAHAAGMSTHHLPAATASTSVTQGPSARRLRRILPRTRVLLVDDTAPNRTIVATLLRREGHKVDVADSGEAALVAVRQTPYDIVLMDIFMPGMNGWDATRALRALGGVAAATPVLALTANTGPDERANCLAAGMQEMFSKPVDVPTLLAAIAHHAWPGAKMDGEMDGDAAQMPAMSPAAEPPAGTPRTYNLMEAAIPAVDEPRLTELRVSLAPVLLADLVDQCLRDIAVRLPALRAALDSGQADQIEAQAHAMAGMAASYAMAALDVRLRRMLVAARNGDAAGARVAAIGIQEDFDRTDAVFRTLFPLVSA